MSLKPGPSHIAVSDFAGEDTNDQSEMQEEEKCYICRQFTPDEIRNSVLLIFTKRVQCSNEDCKHWVHLGYCTPKRVIGRGEVFYCTHCEDKWIRWTIKDVNMFKFIACICFEVKRVKYYIFYAQLGIMTVWSELKMQHSSPSIIYYQTRLFCIVYIMIYVPNMI